ncbi:hypothetical protein EVAR_31778_1 [Eumeta japonica]|uniref:Uncharacterized protein n=1 Tax=Eumeta variegata TaxID=151549 RepID=A0A4C1W5R3_EUMVA|nr:hypothetical protein EVAR_31778_1 [Eumeta japonica]
MLKPNDSATDREPDRYPRLGSPSMATCFALIFDRAFLRLNRCSKVVLRNHPKRDVQEFKEVAEASAMVPIAAVLSESHDNTEHRRGRTPGEDQALGQQSRVTRAQDRSSSDRSDLLLEASESSTRLI